MICFMDYFCNKGRYPIICLSYHFFLISDQHSTKPVYGCPLEEHLQATGREIAFVIETCVSILYHEGLEEEGLFRIAGSAAKLKKLKVCFSHFSSTPALGHCI